MTNCPTCNAPLENPAECNCGWRKDETQTATSAEVRSGPILLGGAGEKSEEREREQIVKGGKAQKPDPPAKEQSAKEKEKGKKKGEQNPFRRMDAKRGGEAGGSSYDPNQFLKRFKAGMVALGHGNMMIDQLVVETGKRAEEEYKAKMRSQGDRNILIDQVNIEAAKGAKREKSEKKTKVKQSYVEVVKILHPRSGLELPEFELDGLARYVAELKKSRLLVINCFNDDLADAAASELVGSLDPDGSWQRFYLDCDRDDIEESDIKIDLFTSPVTDVKTSSVVLVAASGNRGAPFLESLTGNALKARQVSGYLESNNLWLICRADWAHLRRPAADDKPSFFYPFWEMDCLPALLQYHFPDVHETLNARIGKLRGAGFWKEDDGVVCSRVRGLITSGQLVEEVSRLEQSEPPAREETDSRAGFIRSHFKGGDSIKDTVLYVAAYFPNINPHEFNRVVSALLEGLTTKVAVPAPKAAGPPAPAEPTGGANAQTSAGEQQPAFIWEEQSLLRAWQDGADGILAECRLGVVVGKDAARRLDFDDPALRQDLRTYLEAERGFYLKKQFDRIQHLGLLFDRSLNINEGVVDLAVNMALDSPENFGRNWLFDMVTALAQLVEAAGSEVVTSDGVAYRPALPANVEAAMRVVYSTVARLVRKMLEHPHLEKTINDFFTQLMVSRQHEAVLHIVRRLQTAQQFELKWFRQLFDQGGEDVRLAAYLALYERVWQRDAGIYEVLQPLESWLPERDRDPLFYSPSNEFALRLMFEYCLNTTAEFDSKFFGSWPCRYPLLATPGLSSPEGEQAAQGNLSLLAGWLFHPGLQELLAEEEDGGSAESVNVLLGALLVEWAVLLLGSDVAAGGANGNGARPSAPPPEASTVFDLLLRKVISVTTAAQQNELLACWANLADYFLWHLNNSEMQGGEPRLLLSRRRNWVRYLIKRFKILRRQAD